jgi:hypothetical protein
MFKATVESGNLLFAIIFEGPNRALGAPTLQTNTAYTYYSSYAVDGDYSTITSTGIFAGSWWSVDLSSPRRIIAVNVTNFNLQGKLNFKILIVHWKGNLIR